MRAGGVGAQGWERRGGQPRAYGEPEDKSNFTDPDSAIMKTGAEGFQQCYNAQVAVDGEHQLIVATELTSNASDQGKMMGLLDEVKETAQPETVLADAGYCNERDLSELEARGIDGYVAPGREGKKTACRDAHTHPATHRMVGKLATPAGRERYAQRKWLRPMAGSPWLPAIQRAGQGARGMGPGCLALNIKRPLLAGRRLASETWPESLTSGVLPDASAPLEGPVRHCAPPLLPILASIPARPSARVSCLSTAQTHSPHRGHWRCGIRHTAPSHELRRSVAHARYIDFKRSGAEPNSRQRSGTPGGFLANATPSARPWTTGSRRTCAMAGPDVRNALPLRWRNLTWTCQTTDGQREPADRPVPTRLPGVSPAPRSPGPFRAEPAAENRRPDQHERVSPRRLARPAHGALRCSRSVRRFGAPGDEARPARTDAEFE